jgi:hypothetical protein
MRRERTGLLRGAFAALLLIAVGWVAAGGLSSLNPFKEKTVDRSPPAVLKSISKLSEYHAATARLQQVVDVEHDVAHVPGFIAGSRTTMVAAGSVDAVVDFGRLDKRNVRLSQDGKAATLMLPAPRLAKPQLDLKQSRIVGTDRGLVNRVGSIFESGTESQRTMLVRAQDKLARAAAADRELPATARRNTTRMLTGLLKGLGVERVTVRYAAPPAL